jgi:hypothetical protein
LGAGLIIQPVKRLLLRNPNRGGQGPNWAVQPYDYNDEILPQNSVQNMTTILQVATLTDKKEFYEK